MGINLVARSWAMPTCGRVTRSCSAKWNIIPTSFPGGSRPADRRDPQVYPRHGGWPLDLEAMDRLLGHRTKLVGVTGGSNVLGTVNPVEEICVGRIFVGAVVLVDGAQSVPHQKTDVTAMRRRFSDAERARAVGPNGVGVLYGRQKLLEAMPPFLTGGGMIRHVTLDSFETDALPVKFEAGTPPIVPGDRARQAIEDLTAIGMEAIVCHERQLTEHAYEVLESIEGVRVFWGPVPSTSSRY